MLEMVPPLCLLYIRILKDENMFNEHEIQGGIPFFI